MKIFYIVQYFVVLRLSVIICRRIPSSYIWFCILLNVIKCFEIHAFSTELLLTLYFFPLVCIVTFLLHSYKTCDQYTEMSITNFKAI